MPPLLVAWEAVGSENTGYNFIFDEMAHAKSIEKTKPTSSADDEETPEEGNDQEELSVAIILLAAGSSTRMGQSKQLLQINKEPLLLHSTRAALASGVKNVVVILGANEQAHRDVLTNLPITIITNHYWKSGMGSSIKTGMNNLLRLFPETAAVVIMVCDQPAITGNHLRMLIQKFEDTKGPIIASAYADTAGVPVLFARPFFSNILMLRDEHGAKKIIQQFSTKVNTVDFPGGLHDLDTTEDYKNFIDGK
ncbi:MAG: nucleotidyltransferase family protein [Cyclobacteriaceae bacterium]|nr:nucleotidyltransferase family protein [Cyclobacteriaceae bacterium]MDH4298880.1 nucleotidyltransferase family protein [Cyclobacteriaceae bacterium]MDH5250315.1 nucleotidyltransferase family protein [Cyclobacteriaceae bacterium]